MEYCSYKINGHKSVRLLYHILNAALSIPYSTTITLQQNLLQILVNSNALIGPSSNKQPLKRTMALPRFNNYRIAFSAQLRSVGDFSSSQPNKTFILKDVLLLNLVQFLRTSTKDERVISVNIIARNQQILQLKLLDSDNFEIACYEQNLSIEVTNSNYLVLQEQTSHQAIFSLKAKYLSYLVTNKDQILQLQLDKDRIYFLDAFGEKQLSYSTVDSEIFDYYNFDKKFILKIDTNNLYSLALLCQKLQCSLAYSIDYSANPPNSIFSCKPNHQFLQMNIIFPTNRIIFEEEQNCQETINFSTKNSIQQRFFQEQENTLGIKSSYFFKELNQIHSIYRKSPQKIIQNSIKMKGIDNSFISLANTQRKTLPKNNQHRGQQNFLAQSNTADTGRTNLNDHEILALIDEMSDDIIYQV